MKRSKLKANQNRVGWLFISPFVVGFALIYLWVFIDSILFSFSRTDMSPTGFSRIWIGWENYQEVLFRNATYNRIVVDSLAQLAFNTVVILIFSLFVAVVLNQKFKGRTFFRAVFFLPIILYTGILLTAEHSNTIMNGAYGGASIDTSPIQAQTVMSTADIQVFFSGVNIGPELTEYVVSAVNNIFFILVNSGVQVIIFLAGLQSISPELYEAAAIEGSSGWETFWKITFPIISPIIYLNLIYTIIDTLTGNFNEAVSMITTLTLNGGQFGVASALAWIYCVIIAVIIGLCAIVVSRFVFYQEGSRPNDRRKARR